MSMQIAPVATPHTEAIATATTPTTTPSNAQIPTVDDGVQETELAWALAEAVKPHLCAVDSAPVFVSIGAGETFAAIRHLCKLVAIKKIPLRRDLAQQCTTWLHAYVGHEDARYLRRLIEDCLVPYAIHGPALVRINRPPTLYIPRAGLGPDRNRC
jgi:hypothetical protein